MMTRLLRSALHGFGCLAVWFSAAGSAASAELMPETVAAYEEYVDTINRRFMAQSGGHPWVDAPAASARTRLLRGEIIAGPAHEDGILDVPHGLIHHWQGVAFIPGATLEQVLAVARDYARYAGTYDWIVASSTVGRDGAPAERRERYRVFLRIERSASVVTSVVDLWTIVDYRYPRADLATSMSDADCVRHVEDAGKPSERRLPVGQGGGYLWRANTLSTYLERDGGVYVGVETVGLSRGFPPMLGWIIEPIARRLGRGSAADSLRQLREAVAGKTPRREGSPPTTVKIPTFWCTEDGSAAATLRPRSASP